MSSNMTMVTHTVRLRPPFVSYCAMDSLIYAAPETADSLATAARSSDCKMNKRAAPVPLFNMAKRTRQPVQASPFEVQTPPTLGTATSHSSHCPPTVTPLPQRGGQSWARHNTPSPMDRSWTVSPFGQRHGREAHTHCPPATPQSDPLHEWPHPATPAAPNTRHQATAPKLPGQAPQRARPKEVSLRVITATACGVMHWSHQMEHLPILFEVFGSMQQSPSAVEAGCKQFAISATDGVLRCLFYEMDYPFPPLAPGAHLRCVGSWSGGENLLRCVSVREAWPQEQRQAKGLVAASDQALREAGVLASEQ